MPKLCSALKFAFWNYCWSLGLFVIAMLFLTYGTKEKTGPDWWLTAFVNLKSIWTWPLPIFPAALIGFFLAPQWGTGLALGLFWLWTWWKMPAEVAPYLTILIMLAAGVASVPDLIRPFLLRQFLIRQRLNRWGRRRLSSRHD